ncbi:hypothetical protein [Lichenicoccus sp.]|uniref:hypothetical protein n=1 Tax=Lichenicoccus sp. TaxID=2781899 RepID=UPI003D13B21C
MRTTASAAIGLGVMLALAACESHEGPAEKAGSSIDNTLHPGPAQKTGHTIDKALGG